MNFVIFSGLPCKSSEAYRRIVRISRSFSNALLLHSEYRYKNTAGLMILDRMFNNYQVQKIAPYSLTKKFLGGLILV